MALTIHHTTLESGVVVLTPSGNMTLGPLLHGFEAKVKELVDAGQTRIVVDMSQVSYVDSSAIGTIVGCYTMAKGAGGQLRLSGLVDRVQKIFKMAGVLGVLSIDKTRDESIAQF